MGFWEHALLVGGGGLLVPTALLLICVRWARSAFAEDYPDSIRAALPEFDRVEIVRGRILGPLFLISLLAVVLLAAWSWLGADEARGYPHAYAMAFTVFALFALIDLLVVDWLVICWWRPSWVLIPGTEDDPAWRDYRFHLRAQFSPKGLIALVGLPAVIAGLAVLIPH
ncbi:hypothetical protein [Nocardia sp. CC227C]|uniref:hypothetical protein n=1 Tax=Nocardia sp. CC227C TaxID=3044562 RepID=UPI00278C7F8A|nr:hypothetical protein [Nocardia sp. CC227C]